MRELAEQANEDTTLELAIDVRGEVKVSITLGELGIDPAAYEAEPNALALIFGMKDLPRNVRDKIKSGVERYLYNDWLSLNVVDAKEEES